MEPTSTATLVTPESIPELEKEPEPPPTGITCGSSRLKINRRRQEGNPLNKYIRNVPYEWNSEIKCDFECSKNCGVLYLSLKYHKLHPGYIETRLNDLNGYQVKVLLALTNVEDPSFLLRDLNILCYRTRITLTLCYSVEEAAEYIESFKITENKSVEKTLSAIQQRKAEWLSNRTT